MEINKSKNYGLYIDKLSKMGFETTKLEDDYGERLIDATFSISNDNGLAYDGSLLQTVLYKLTPYAIKINDLYPEEIRVNKESLIKVCLLHQIAKAVRLIKNDNEWERDKRGLLYKYDSKQPAIKTGMHSLVIAQNCGIPFTPEEAEAMTINDRDPSDDQARWHSSIMSTIIRQANEMVYMEAINTQR